jgi:hypothetical protein
MVRALVVLAALSYPLAHAQQWYAPVAVPNRQSTAELRLTRIGAYGLARVARPGIPGHLHTGIDIRRPSRNYDSEPVFPAGAGVVVSVRRDGPYAQIIVAHPGADTVWTVYEHVAGITCALGELVDPLRPMARFFDREELRAYGAHFDHLHFEVLKVRPVPVKPTAELPERCFTTYALCCYDRAQLETRTHDPIAFLDSVFASEHAKR